MKLKDIEKNLKAETDGMSVPDVLSAVKKTPINALLTGETPQQVFKKKMALRLLVVVLALFTMLSISLFAFLITPNKSDVTSDSLLTVTVENGDEQTRYGLVVTAENIVVIAVNETTYEKKVSLHDKSLNDALDVLYHAKSGDNVRVCVHNDDSQIALAIAEATIAQLHQRYSTLVVYNLNYALQDNSDKLLTVEFINNASGKLNVDVNTDLKTLVKLYIAL